MFFLFAFIFLFINYCWFLLSLFLSFSFIFRRIIRISYILFNLWLWIIKFTFIWNLHLFFNINKLISMSPFFPLLGNKFFCLLLNLFLNFIIWFLYCRNAVIKDHTYLKVIENIIRILLLNSALSLETYAFYYWVLALLFCWNLELIS